MWLSKKGYYLIRHNGKDVLLHRKIYEEAYGEIPDGYCVHHVNGIRTDNRLENLELLPWGLHTAHHNIGNKRAVGNDNGKYHRCKGAQKNNKLGIKGVSKMGNKYYVKIWLNGKTIQFGGYDTAEEAARKYDEEIIKINPQAYRNNCQDKYTDQEKFNNNEVKA